MDKIPEKEAIKEQVPQVKKTWWQRLPRFLFRVFIGFMTLFLIIFLLFQIPAFQTYVAKKITDSLSESWGTRVELDGVQLEFFDRLVLRNFYVEDLNQDTLLFAEQLKVDLNTGPIALLMRRLEIEEISLKTARINMSRAANSEEQNAKFLIDALSRDDQLNPNEYRPDKKKKPFYLNLNSLYLEDVLFSKMDSLYGSDQAFYISRGEFIFEYFDLLNNTIELSALKLEDPKVDIHIFPWNSEKLNEIHIRDSIAEINKWPPDISNSKKQFLFPWDFLSYSDFSFMAWQLEWPPVDSILGFKEPEPSLRIFLQSLDLMGGSFSLENTRFPDGRVVPENVIDFRDLQVTDIYANIRDFAFQGKTYQGDIRRIAFETDAGFIAKKLSSKRAYVDSKRVQLDGLEIITPYSSIEDRVVLTYDEFTDFKSFVNEVELDSVNIRNASIAIRDIMAFAPALENNIYFQNNRDKTLKVDADLFGTIDNLSGNNLSIILDKTTFLNGSFGFFNLTYPENQYLNLELDRMVTNMATLRQLIPNFNPPPNFDKLGQLDFEGRFDGFFYDFVANGDLRSDLGQAVLDMKLRSVGGRENADYSGVIQLIGFDLGTWTDNNNFGKITMSSQVLDGKGLTASSAKANLQAKVDSFLVRGYNYQNLEFAGALQENLFDGEFTITDDNIDLDFKGTIDFTDQVPILVFDSDIRMLDLKRLNLIEADYRLQGKIDLNVRDIDPNAMQGKIRLHNLIIENGPDNRFLIDSVVLISEVRSEIDRTLNLESDVLRANLDGRFQVEQIPGQFLTFAHKHFPKFSTQLNIPVQEKQVDSTSSFDYSMEIFDTKGLMELVDPKLEELSDIFIIGSFDIPEETFKFDLEAAQVQYSNLVFDDIVVVVKAREGGSDINIAVSETRVGENLTLAPINLLGLVDQDTLFFGITAYDFTEILNKVELDGVFFPVDEDFVVRFEQSDIILWNELWQIDAYNFLRIGDDYVRTRDFILRNGNRRIILESLGKRGLLFQLDNYDLESLNELLEYDPIQFDGNIDVYASIKDIFEFEDLQVNATTDSLIINGDDFGAFQIKLKADNFKSKIVADINGGIGNQLIDIAGYYNPPLFEQVKTRDPANFLNFEAKLTDFPLAVLEYWIGDGLKDTEGKVQADIAISGPPTKPVLSGTAIIDEASVTVDYLNTTYFIDDQELQLSSSIIDATGAVLTDQEGNIATIKGGIVHDHLRDFELAVTLNTNRFLGLNTVKGQNSLFYGTAYANGSVTFSGPFNKTDIYVNADASRGTEITLPVDYGRDASEVSFIKFSNKRQQQEEEENNGPTAEQLGTSIMLDLNLNELAQVSIVFDEQLGDILRAKGRGTLRLIADRAGDFRLIGNYEVVEGDYLFTLMNIGLNKKFIVAPGSTLNWSGDPFGAQIDLTAKYEDLTTQVANFVTEYLLTASQNAKDQAAASSDVDLSMRLTGELLNPDIDFDIDFPTLTGELKSYTDSKLRLVRQDQNEMNRQVFGLLVAGQFLPSDFSLSGNEFNIGFNTVTEMIFQQFSNYLTGLVSEWLREDGLISGIDFDIDYTALQDLDPTTDNPTNYYQSGELEVRLRNYLLDDRLTVNVGGNFDLGGNDYVDTDPNSGAYFAGDVIIEYALTEDRNLKIRFYQSTEPELNGDRLNRTGVGLSYRKQFDSFNGFLDGLKGTTRRMKRDKDKELKDDN